MEPNISRPETISEFAREFLASLGDPSGYETSNYAVDLVNEDPELGWLVILSAASQAKTQYELECVGAFLIEELLQKAGTEFINRVESEILASAPFAVAASFVRMSGSPESVWKGVNNALRRSGVPEERLVDWSRIIPIPSEDT